MSAGYIPFHPNPSKPKYKPPAGAVDAHCHVFGPEAKFPFAPKRKYTPCDAPKEKLFALRDFLGFDKNVIVQATCHDTDNRALVDALESSNGKAKGVAFVGEEITDAELQGAGPRRRARRALQLHQAAGRFHAADVMQRIATRIAKLGWHIVIYFEHADLDEMGPFFTSLPTTLVFDHMACPNVKEGVDGKHFQNWLKALDANKTWITKVTCPERFTVAGPPYDDVVPFARAIVERFPDRVLWGTDWPHPNMKKEAPDDGVLVDMIPKIAPTRGAAAGAAGRQSDAALLELVRAIDVRSEREARIAPRRHERLALDAMRTMRHRCARIWRAEVRRLTLQAAALYMRTLQGETPMATRSQQRLRRHPRHLRVRRRALAPGLRHQHVLHVADEGREPQGLQGERGRVPQAVPADAGADARRSSSATTTACWSSAATSISPPSSARPTAIRSGISPR